MKAFGFVLTVGIALSAVQVSAAPVIFQWSNAPGGSTFISGSYAPVAAGGSISPAYLEAKFTDIGANKVQLDIISNMAAPADLDKISFNIAPDALANNLIIFSHTSNIVGLMNNTNEGPIHTFDLALDTGQGNSGLGLQQIGSVVFTLKSPTTPAGLTLLASSFNTYTMYNGTKVYSAAHFQNVGPGGGSSSFIASGGSVPPGGDLDSTPLPSAAGAGVSLLGGICLVRRRVGKN
jgi:hypothetical protein